MKFNLEKKQPLIIGLTGTTILICAALVIKNFMVPQFLQPPNISVRQPDNGISTPVFKKNENPPEISFRPETSAPPRAGQSFAVTVMPDREMFAIAYRLQITYNPNIITIREATPGAFFDEFKILEKIIDNQEGELNLVVGMTPRKNFQEPGSQQPLASLTFKVAANPQKESTTLSFGPRTTIVSQKEGWFRNNENNLPNFGLPITQP